MIVKIQKPLFSSDGSNMALVYDEERTFEAHMPFEQCAPLFGPDDLKVYCRANLRGTVLEMGERLPEQPW